MSAPELKCCPFCGKNADADGFHEAFSTDSSFPFVGCVNQTCNAQIPYFRESEQIAAITAWNTRADTTAAPSPSSAEKNQ